MGFPLLVCTVCSFASVFTKRAKYAASLLWATRLIYNLQLLTMLGLCDRIKLEML